MGDDQQRQVRDMQSLLRFCVEETAREGNASHDGNEATLSEDRRRFLEEALSGASDIVEEMRKQISTVRTCLQSESYQDAINAINILTDIVADIDNSTDFHKIGGFELFVPLISSSNCQLQVKGCHLLAEIVQNNSYCQKAAVEHNLLPLLVKTIDNDPDEEVRVKALYALSCLIRGNEEIQLQFESAFDGFSVLLRALQTNSESNKLRIKTSFILTSLCQQQPNFRATLVNMGLIEQIVVLLHEPHDKSHEFLLAALYSLVSEYKPSLNECRRNELKLESLLRQRLQLIKGNDEFREEEEYCQQLLQLCFNGEADLNDTDR